MNNMNKGGDLYKVGKALGISPKVLGIGLSLINVVLTVGAFSAAAK
jgi:hypothetical protein